MANFFESNGQKNLVEVRAKIKTSVRCSDFMSIAILSFELQISFEFESLPKAVVNFLKDVTRIVYI